MERYKSEKGVIRYYPAGVQSAPAEVETKKKPKAKGRKK